MRRKIKNEELNRLTNEEFRSSIKTPISVVLDNVRSLNNVGSAFRTCDAFLVDKLYLTGVTGQPPHRDINKTALGATESVDWEYHEDPVDLVKKLKTKGYIVIAVEQVEEAEVLSNFKIDSDQHYVLVFGNEVFGVKDEVVQVANTCLEIPQLGTKHSLNISVSIGVVLWNLPENWHSS